MDQLRIYFERMHKLSDEEWQAFQSTLERQELKKNDFLLEEGKTCRHLHFIQEGAFRFFYLKDGKELVTAFFFSGDFVTNYRSFLTGQPSDHSIEALRDSVVWSINKQNLHDLYDRYPVIDRLGRLMAERLYLVVTQRLDNLLYNNPEERYLDLLRRGSKLLQEVPQYMLASYLGVSAESLSRIRKRIRL